MQEKPKNVMIDLCLHCIVPFINTSISLSEGCKKVKLGMHFIGLWFTELFIFFPNLLSRLSSSLDKLQDTYWSMPKSPLQAITFCTFAAQVVLQADTPGCSHTLSSISKMCGKEHHYLSSPSWDILCMA